jgi:hypothetical protein
VFDAPLERKPIFLGSGGSMFSTVLLAFKGTDSRCNFLRMFIDFGPLWVAIGSPNGTIGVSLGPCLALF